MFRNLDCLSLVVCSNTTLLKLQTVLFLFFSKFCTSKSGVRLIYGCGLYTDVYGNLSIMNSFDDKCSKIGVVLSIDFFIWHFILFYRYFSLRDKDGQIDSEQRGLFRTNCIDSLDR